MNIRAIVADVDGVMVGKHAGVNFPLPHDDVIAALRKVSGGGIPVILCTAKFSVGIRQIAIRAGLENPHITDGGALVINLVRNEIIREHPLPKDIVKRFAENCLEQGIYLELYGATSYYVQRSQVIPFTEKRSELLQQEPDLVDSLSMVAERERIIKMLFLTDDPDELAQGRGLTRELGDAVNFIVSHHPFLDPWIPSVITASGVSKYSAMREVLDTLGLDASSVLGIGDSASDWDFMEHCGAVGVVGDHDRRLQERAMTKGDGNYYLAKSVDDHGLIEVLKRFQLL